VGASSAESEGGVEETEVGQRGREDAFEERRVGSKL
jgi:hypothetical protein